MLLDWAAQSGNLNTIAADKVKTDEATGLPKNTKGKVYFDSSSLRPEPGQGDPGDQRRRQVPDAELHQAVRRLAVRHERRTCPAHVIAEKALGITDPQEAKDALIKAIQDKDEAALAKISEFWNTGYDYTKMPNDKDLALSSGAYVIKDFKENEYMTLEKNPEYKGDHPGVDRHPDRPLERGPDGAGPGAQER